MGLAALMEKLGFGGREMAASGHSKDFVLRVVQVYRPLPACKTGTPGIEETSRAGYRLGNGLP